MMIFKKMEFNDFSSVVQLLDQNSFLSCSPTELLWFRKATLDKKEDVPNIREKENITRPKCRSNFLYRVVEITTILKICGFFRRVSQLLRIYTDYC